MNEGMVGVSTLEPCATFTALVDANRALLLPSVAPKGAFVRSKTPRATDAVDSALHCCCCCCCDTSKALPDCNARVGNACHSTARRVAHGLHGSLSLEWRGGNSLRLASMELQALKTVALLQSKQAQQHSNLQPASSAVCSVGLIPPHSRLPGFGLFLAVSGFSFGL